MSTNESPRNTFLPEPPPHPSKFAKTKQVWIFLGVTGAFCILLVMLLYTFADRTPSQVAQGQSDDVVELLGAPTVTVDIANTDLTEIGVSLRAGGWIQQTDENGNLSQQYRCTALDPSPANMPEGWIEMTNPDVELFLSKSRVVRIRGNAAIANAPNRALESGDIYGDVRIELFEGVNINTQTDTPSIVMTTPQASFDNFLGEVTCDSEVRVVSSNGSSLAGRQLAIRFSDANGRIEYLRLEEVDAITLYQDQLETVQRFNAPALVAKSTNRNHRVAAGAINNPEQYYLLTLADHVIIKQGDLLTGKEGRGETMTIAFALNAGPQQRAVAHRQSFPLSPNATIVATCLGIATEPINSNQTDVHIPPQNQEPTIITCNGGMTMLPIDDVSLKPTFPEETRLEIFGDANSPAILLDHAASMSARAHIVRYEVDQERVDLFGDSSAKAIVAMNDSTAYANHLWLSQKSGEGQIVGEGSIEQRADAGIKTTITWQGGVDFTMTPATSDQDGGVLEQVVCRNDILMISDESTLACDELDIRFAPDGEGDSAPELAIAIGNVKATSDTQKLWADRAEVTFLASTTKTEESNDEFGDSLTADKMTATGDVQVLLNDGGRAFCNTLRGDMNQSIAELDGDVVVAYKRMLMDRGSNALFRINRSTGKGLWEGPGQARFLTQPLNVGNDARMSRPEVTVDSEETVDDPDAQHISMRATWQDSMAIDQHFNNEAGMIDFRGTVVARSRQSSVELTEIRSESLQFEFTNEPGTEAESASLPVDRTNEPAPEIEIERDDRRLHRIIAREKAKFEHRLWDKDAPSQLPVVYYIGGNHIEYETDTSELLAVGNGELLIRDERKPLTATHQSSLGGRGATKFSWDGNLRTTQMSGDNYRVSMTDNVQMIHKGLDGLIGMLTGDKITAISKNTTSKDQKKASTVMMRGMDVQQIKAQENVYVSTSTRRVDCDVFDYNLQNGLAKLSASKGRTIAIVTEGTPYPVRATSILWNMDPSVDSIKITGLQGSSNK